MGRNCHLLLLLVAIFAACHHLLNGMESREREPKTRGCLREDGGHDATLKEVGSGR